MFLSVNVLKQLVTTFNSVCVCVLLNVCVHLYIDYTDFCN